MTDAMDPIPFLKGERVDTAAMAEILGITPAELDSAVRRGCPAFRTGGVRSPRQYDTAIVFAWFTLDKIRKHGGEENARAVRLEFERDALAAELERRKR